MIKKYKNFLNENKDFTYKLYVEENNNDFESNINWDLIINFENLWEKFQNNKINIENFVQSFKYKINEYKSEIIQKKGLNTWNNLAILLNNFKNYESITINKKMNEIYDWADINNIKIEIK